MDDAIVVRHNDSNEYSNDNKGVIARTWIAMHTTMSQQDENDAVTIQPPDSSSFSYHCVSRDLLLSLSIFFYYLNAPNYAAKIHVMHKNLTVLNNLPYSYKLFL